MKVRLADNLESFQETKKKDNLESLMIIVSVRNSCKKVNGYRACNFGKLEAPDKSCKFY